MGDMTRREEILLRIRDIPPLPASIQEAMSLLRDPDVDMSRLARVIEHDPSMTANVLKLVNSPYFAGHTKISTVREAIVRIGARQLSQLLLTVGVVPRVKGELVGYDLPPCALLEHSLAVAVASELVARVVGRTPPPHTFTAGLLVNIGKTALGDFLEVDAEEILEAAEAEGLTFVQAERKVLGIDHAEAGAVLLQSWSVPPEIVEVVRHRLDPDSFDGDNPALDLVHAGDAVARMTGIGQGLDGMQYRLSERVLERLDLAPAQMELVMADLLEHVAELRDVLAKCDPDKPGG